MTTAIDKKSAGGITTEGQLFPRVSVVISRSRNVSRQAILQMCRNWITHFAALFLTYAKARQPMILPTSIMARKGSRSHLVVTATQHVTPCNWNCQCRNFSFCSCSVGFGSPRMKPRLRTCRFEPVKVMISPVIGFNVKGLEERLLSGTPTLSIMD